LLRTRLKPCPDENPAACDERRAADCG
jgi:hypothetical protein